jgi:glycosyltransferase involved in cell wall biosynthesis
LYGLNRLNRSLQPWRYVTEVAVRLSRLGHRVEILSEAGPHALSFIDGVPVKSLASVRNSFWQQNKGLAKAIQSLDPDILLWSIGLTSFLHQDYRFWKERKQVGIFSSPIYSIREVLRPGVFKLAANYPLSSIHVLGAFTPRWLLRARAASIGLDAYVTQTETTKHRLAPLVGVKPVSTLLPGVDRAWLDCTPTAPDVRARMGLGKDDFVVLYFGSPAPLRGLPELVEALAMIHAEARNIKLLVLNRRYKSELIRESASVEDLITVKGLGDSVRIIHGFLGQETLIEAVQASDLVALPFELVPSDAPLSILEAVAASKPVLTSRLACLPELASHGKAFLAEPGDPVSVAQALLAARSNACGESNHRSGAIRSWEAVGAEWSALIQSL